MDEVGKINLTNSELHNSKSSHHPEQISECGQPVQKHSTEMESRMPANNITLNQSSTRDKTTKRRSEERRENDFIFGKEIGEGSFSSVYLVKDIHTQQEFAAKKCLKAQIIKEKKIENVMRERQIMNMLNLNEDRTAPFFVKLAYAFQTEANFFFILSYCKHGEFLSLIQQVGNFDHDSAQFYTGEIVRALEHLHSLGVVHRDLKPENILLDEKMHIKISDFGSAKRLETHVEDTPGVVRPSSFVGTAQYVSPEVVHYKQVCLASDLWSLGCIIYQIVSGLPPFRSKSDYIIFKSILNVSYEFPLGFFDDAKDMVEKLLVLDTTRRLGANDPHGQYDSLRQHPFLAPIDLDTLYLATPPTITTFAPDCDDQQSIWDESIPPGLEARELDLLMNSKPSQTIFQQPATTRQQPPMSRQNSVPSHSSKNADVTTSLQKQQPQPPKPPLRKTSSVIPRTSSGSSSKGRRNLADLTQDEHNRRLLEQERDNKWHKFVEGNLILKQGLLDKKKGLFPRTRMFLLTTGPHLYYVDPVNNVLKGQVPYGPTIRPEGKNFRTFFVHTPHRTYYLEDHSNCSLQWIQAIEEVRDYYYPPSADNRQ